MSYHFVIAPDFSPECFAGWHMLNTLLQKRSNLSMRIETPASHDEQFSVIESLEPEVIYANPFDTAELINKKGYKAIARPIGKSNEMVIVTKADGDIKALSDLNTKSRISMADNRDVKLIGLRLLEAEDLNESDVDFHITENYQAAARDVIQGKSAAAFFLEEAFNSLSKLTKSQLQPLIKSDISVLSHSLLVKKDFAETTAIQDIFLSLHEDEKGQNILDELGLEQGFEAMNDEDAAFMIDLMETLLD